MLYLVIVWVPVAVIFFVQLVITDDTTNQPQFHDPELESVPYWFKWMLAYAVLAVSALCWPLYLASHLWNRSWGHRYWLPRRWWRK